MYNLRNTILSSAKDDSVNLKGFPEIDYNTLLDDKPSESSTGRKFDDGKPRYSLLPPKALKEIVKVLTYGSTKYADFNWQKVPNAYDRYFSAANRHMWEWKEGKVLDSENNLHHLAAAITNLMFILDMELNKEKESEISRTIRKSLSKN